MTEVSYKDVAGSVSVYDLVLERSIYYKDEIDKIHIVSYVVTIAPYNQELITIEVEGDTIPDTVKELVAAEADTGNKTCVYFEEMRVYLNDDGMIRQLVNEALLVK